jgi:transcriptional regulator GlxA family with amidase domain
MAPSAAVPTRAPSAVRGEPPLRRIAVIIADGVAPFEFSIACEVFGVDRTADGVPRFILDLCTPKPGPVRTSIGFDIVVPNGLGAVDEADLVIIAPVEGSAALDFELPEGIAAALHRTVNRGARIASFCSGSFLLGRAGLLDGRRVTTHWMYADLLRRMYPEAKVEPDVLYVEDGPVYTSAGTAAGIDLCLHLVRKSHGPEVANAIARRMVVPPHREGGQAQFVRTPVSVRPAETLAPLLDWAIERLHEDLPVTRLAKQASMSSRTFARRFQDETGSSPHTWLLMQRVALAERLLESSDAPVEEIASRCGFGSATMLRHHFTRMRGTTPTAYRRTFTCALPDILPPRPPLPGQGEQRRGEDDDRTLSAVG